MVAWIAILLISVYVDSTQASFNMPTWNMTSCGSDCGLLLDQMGVRLKFLDDICKCENSACQCCFEGSLPLSDMTQRFCMKSAFRWEDLEFKVQATMNGNTLGQFGLNGRNPPPLCFPVPLPIPIPLSVCIRGTDIYPQDNNMHVCVDMWMRFADHEFLKMHLNCMWVGLDGLKIAENNNNPTVEKLT